MKSYKRDLRKLLKLYDDGEIGEREYFELKRELEKVDTMRIFISLFAKFKEFILKIKILF